MTSKKNLHISTEIDHRSNLSSQSTPAKCKMPRTGQFLPRRRARTGRNMEASSYCLGMPNGLLPLGLRWLILDPKRIPNVWFVESRLLFRNVGKHSHHRYIIDIYIYISIYLSTYHKHTSSWSYNPTNPLFAKARGPSVGALAPSRFFNSLLEALLTSQAQAVTWMRRGKP